MNDNNDFNPAAWQDIQPDQAPKENAPKAVFSGEHNSIAEDVEIVIQRIEEQGLDITKIYDDWFRLAFAFASEFGEGGRPLFHRISRLFPNYNYGLADKQYTACLRGSGSGITIKTFFYKAKKAGIDIRTRSTKSPELSKFPKISRVSNDNIGNIDNKGGSDDAKLPTFSDLVEDKLPEFLRETSAVGESPQETDALLIAAITVIGSCLPGVQGKYDGVTVYPNLFFFLSARASSGKGRLSLCRYLVRPIHRRLKELREQQMEKYEQELAHWEGANRKERGPKPKKPAQTMLIIPANTSATAVYQLLADNGGRGLIFETEGDTLANAFASDFGNFSDGFRKAFHHEPISYHRRGGDEDVEIERPQLSTVLTGTPRQIADLIKSAENGLFSRFIFYRLNSKLEWKDVLIIQTGDSLDARFEALGDRFVEFYDILLHSGNIIFRVSDSQRQKFNEFFSSLQSEYYDIFKDEIIASVRRLGLICYRIAMILSALRMMETGDFSAELHCQDADFDTALTISRILAVHMAFVFDELTTTEHSRATSVVKSEKRQRFLNNLPSEFDRQDYLATASKCGVPPSTAAKWISEYCVPGGPLERIEHGRYKKRSV